MTQNWLKLVRHHERRGRLALTLPFLVGALRDPVGAHFDDAIQGYEALVSLLKCFRDEVPDLNTVRLYTCPDLGQPVAYVTSMYYHPGYARWGIPEPERVPLHIDPPYRPEHAADIDAVADLLWPVISAPIVEARFSYSKAAKAYAPFDDGDRKFIADAFAYDEENEL